MDKLAQENTTLRADLQEIAEVPEVEVDPGLFLDFANAIRERIELNEGLLAAARTLGYELTERNQNND